MLLAPVDLFYSNVHIHLKLSDPVTVISDMSGTGKSFIMDAVNDKIFREPDCHYKTLTFDNFHLWKNITIEENILWFIDDIDLLGAKYPEAVEYINSGIIPLIAMGRDFSNFKFDFRAYYDLCFDAERHILTNDRTYLTATFDTEN